MNALLILLGLAVAGTVWTGYGGQYLLLCLGETFAVGLGTTSPVLGVLFQPAIAGMVCGDDRMSLFVGGVAITVAAAGILVFRHSLFPLIALLVISTGIALGLMGFEAWINRRLSSGDVA